MSIDPTGSQLKRSNSSDLERHITNAEVGGAAPVPAVPAGAHGLQRPISDRVEQLRTLASGCCTWVCLFWGDRRTPPNNNQHNKCRVPLGFPLKQENGVPSNLSMGRRTVCPAPTERKIPKWERETPAQKLRPKPCHRQSHQAEPGPANGAIHVTKESVMKPG